MTTNKNSRLIPVTEWHKYYAWPPIGGLRHIIFHAETNGFKEAIVRVGRRVLVDENKFFECAKSQSERIGGHHE